MRRVHLTVLAIVVAVGLFAGVRVSAAADAGAATMSPSEALAKLMAGNTATRAGLESIDYAVDRLGTNLIIVLGHDSCGAVKGATTECVSRLR